MVGRAEQHDAVQEHCVRAGHDAARSGAAIIPHSEGLAERPFAARASLMTMNVFAGNLSKLRQLKAAAYVLPVNSATALVPPKASMTAVVVSSGFVSIPV